MRQLQDIRIERSTNQGGLLSHFDDLWTSHHAIITFQRRGHLCKDKDVSLRHGLQSISIFSVAVNNSPIPKDHFPRYKTSNLKLSRYIRGFVSMFSGTVCACHRYHDRVHDLLPHLEVNTDHDPTNRSYGCFGVPTKTYKPTAHITSGEFIRSFSVGVCLVVPVPSCNGFRTRILMDQYSSPRHNAMT